MKTRGKKVWEREGREEEEEDEGREVGENFTVNSEIENNFDP